jgi:hypothetical protein
MRDRPALIITMVAHTRGEAGTAEADARSLSSAEMMHGIGSASKLKSWRRLAKGALMGDPLNLLTYR